LKTVFYSSLTNFVIAFQTKALTDAHKTASGFGISKLIRLQNRGETVRLTEAVRRNGSVVRTEETETILGTYSSQLTEFRRNNIHPIKVAGIKDDFSFKMRNGEHYSFF
jgi:hypothetical protein